MTCRRYGHCIVQMSVRLDKQHPNGGFVMDLQILRRFWDALRVRATDGQGRVEFFRKQGAHIGRDCHLLVTTLGSEPYLVDIGDETLVSGEVAFITHDAGTWVSGKEHPLSGRFRPNHNRIQSVRGLRVYPHARDNHRR